jgi:hypothetical protein
MRFLIIPGVYVTGSATSHPQSSVHELPAVAGTEKVNNKAGKFLNIFKLASRASAATHGAYRGV